jgi:pimeloyl-ACP methyl ester carboxylesterase
VNPFFLGTADRRLFGIHEPAASHEGKARAAVLCQPWGNEYIYAHRSMRQLAVKLSQAGFHSLRFDYFGSGDSAGEECDTDFAGLQADVAAAIEALKEIAETPRVTLIGLRAGANIAANTAVSFPEVVEALVLWDPIFATDQQCRIIQEGAQGTGLQALIDTLPSRSLILATQGRHSYEQWNRDREAVGAKPAPIEFVTAACPWVESASTSGALPVPVIQRIQEWLR